MTALVDQDIANAGIVGFGGVKHVQQVYVWIRAYGGQVTHPDATFDHVMRAGWVSLGLQSSIIGAVSSGYWRPPIWLNFQGTWWTPDPQSSEAGVLNFDQADQVRWCLSAGTLAHIYVYGP